MTQLSPTALEAAAKAAMLVRARLPGGQEEWPVLSTDPDFDDLPANADEGTPDDDITQETVLLVCTAAITSYLAQREKEGWVMVPLNPNYDMGEAGMGKFASFHDEHPAACVDEIYRAMIANRPLAAAQNGGEPCK